MTRKNSYAAAGVNSLHWRRQALMGPGSHRRCVGCRSPGAIIQLVSTIHKRQRIAVRYYCKHCADQLPANLRPPQTMSGIVPMSMVDV